MGFYKARKIQKWLGDVRWGTFGRPIQNVLVNSIFRQFLNRAQDSAPQAREARNESEGRVRAKSQSGRFQSVARVAGACKASRSHTQQAEDITDYLSKLLDLSLALIREDSMKGWQGSV
jgi:hypothetical protein